MPTHVALLRGVNVGGRNKVPMADLRRLATELGLAEVGTYAQSGNLVFTTDLAQAKVGPDLEAALESGLGVKCDVVVLTRPVLAAAAEANPFPTDDPKGLHLSFRATPLDGDERAAVEAAQAASIAKGSEDRAAVIGATVYLYTPDGLGRSELAARLGRLKGSGTARNWSTVTKLLEMLDH
jgi:uncharacterized protein (DUF1697 family)